MCSTRRLVSTRPSIWSPAPSPSDATTVASPRRCSTCCCAIATSAARSSRAAPKSSTSAAPRRPRLRRSGKRSSYATSTANTPVATDRRAAARRITSCTEAAADLPTSTTSSSSVGTTTASDTNTTPKLAPDKTRAHNRRYGIPQARGSGTRIMGHLGAWDSEDGTRLAAVTRRVCRGSIEVMTDWELVARATSCADALLRSSLAVSTKAERRRARRLGRLLSDPRGRELVFTLADEVLRAGDEVRASRRLRSLVASGLPEGLGPVDRTGLLLAAAAGQGAPKAVGRVVRGRVRAAARGVVGRAP